MKVSSFKVGPVAASIPFEDIDSTYKPSVETVQDALVEVRNTIVQKPDIDTTVLNTTRVLTIEDKSFHIANGTATGYAYRLPLGTSLSNGRQYEIFNNSSQNIIVKDGSGANLFTLNAGDIARLLLYDNATAAGLWIQDINSAFASGILSYSIGSDVTFSTSSNTDVLITGMAVTPDSGRYSVGFSADIIIGNNNRTTQAVIHSNGVAVERTRRRVQGVGSNFESQMDLLGEVVVNGSEEITVKVNVSSGSVDYNQRRLILVRLGT